MKIPGTFCAIGALVLLAGCMQLDLTGIRDTSASDIDPLRPPGAEPGACYGKETSPAVFETVTEHVLIRAARYDADGALDQPAAYRTETRQEMIRDRTDIWFRVPCEADRVEAFVASLQRALKVRGFYHGKITGEVNAATRRAIRKFQQPFGPDSAKLSLDAARKLGLVAVERSDG